MLMDLIVAWQQGDRCVPLPSVPVGVCIPRPDVLQQVQESWHTFYYHANRADIGGPRVFAPFVLSCLIRIANWMQMPLTGRDDLPLVLREVVEIYPLGQRILVAQDQALHLLRL